MLAEPVRRRRRWRLFGLSVLLVGAGLGVAVGLGQTISWPFDVVVNLGGEPTEPALHAPADGQRRVVVLQHGIWRTAASLGRLERTLRAHGYEVHNLGYPSMAACIGDHARRLRDEVERIFVGERVHELMFVGHSMGGLVVQEYLRRADARPTAACVYLGTPHRGAILLDLRKHWFVFRLVMGSSAALQLSPGDALHARPIPAVHKSGAIVGDCGEGNAAIPGADDGTVAVIEATLLGAKDCVTLPLGHTRLTTDAQAIVQVLHFLRHGGFLH